MLLGKRCELSRQRCRPRLEASRIRRGVERNGAYDDVESVLETVHDRSVPRQGTRIGCSERTRRLSRTLQQEHRPVQWRSGPSTGETRDTMADPQQIQRRLLGRRRLCAARTARL
jgi:hypothetical protein